MLVISLLATLGLAMGVPRGAEPSDSGANHGPRLAQVDVTDRTRDRNGDGIQDRYQQPNQPESPRSLLNPSSPQDPPRSLLNPSLNPQDPPRSLIR